MFRTEARARCQVQCQHPFAAGQLTLPGWGNDQTVRVREGVERSRILASCAPGKDLTALHASFATDEFFKAVRGPDVLAQLHLDRRSKNSGLPQDRPNRRRHIQLEADHRRDRIAGQPEKQRPA